MTTPAATFLAAVRGIPAHHVAAVMTHMIPGVIYSSTCTKQTLARSYENASNPRWTDSASCAIRRLDLDTVARRAKARMAGERGWFDA
jgi:hypothetical protein